MDLQRVLNILAISMPVFAMMGLGRLFAHRGHLSSETRSFINWIVYYFALPALIFNEVARQRPNTFMEPALFIVPLLAILILTAIASLGTRSAGIRGALAAPCVFGTFWANVTYMGFPLARNAFGEQGLAYAAVYNAILMPSFVVLGYLLISFYNPRPNDNPAHKLYRAFQNPIVAAAILGIVVACVAELFRDSAGQLNLPEPLSAVTRLVGSFLTLIGAVGLPLALLEIGAALRLRALQGRCRLLGAVLAAKLVALPLLVLVLIRLLSPETPAAVTGVSVLLSAMPGAVASYVIAAQENTEPDFVASLLALGTLASVVTIPLWLYALL